MIFGFFSNLALLINISIIRFKSFLGQPCHVGEHPGGGGRRLRLLLRGQRHRRSHHPWGAGAGLLSGQQIFYRALVWRFCSLRFSSRKTRLVRIFCGHSLKTISVTFVGTPKNICKGQKKNNITIAAELPLTAGVAKWCLEGQCHWLFDSYSCNTHLSLACQLFSTLLVDFCTDGIDKKSVQFKTKKTCSQSNPRRNGSWMISFVGKTLKLVDVKGSKD